MFYVLLINIFIIALTIIGILIKLINSDEWIKLSDQRNCLQYVKTYCLGRMLMWVNHMHFVKYNFKLWFIWLFSQISDAVTNETYHSYCKDEPRVSLLNSSYIRIIFSTNTYSTRRGFLLYWKGKYNSVTG